MSYTALSPRTQAGEDVALDVIEDLRKHYGDPYGYHTQDREELVRLIVNIVERILAKGAQGDGS